MSTKNDFAMRLVNPRLTANYGQIATNVMWRSYKPVKKTECPVGKPRLIKAPTQFANNIHFAV